MTSRDMFADGKLIVKPDGKHLRVHADQLEVTADGKLLYFMPCSGPCSKIETRWLDDANLTSEQLASHVQPFYDNPTIGGTAIDAAGNVYFDDADHQRVTRVTPSGQASTVVEDKQRLHWGDAMWIDDSGYLWIPVPQMERTPGMNLDNLDHVQYPVSIYRLKIDQAPVRR